MICFLCNETAIPTSRDEFMSRRNKIKFICDTVSNRVGPFAGLHNVDRICKNCIGLMVKFCTTASSERNVPPVRSGQFTLLKSLLTTSGSPCADDMRNVHPDKVQMLTSHKEKVIRKVRELMDGHGQDPDQLLLHLNWLVTNSASTGIQAPTPFPTTSKTLSLLQLPSPSTGVINSPFSSPLEHSSNRNRVKEPESTLPSPPHTSYSGVANTISENTSLKLINTEPNVECITLESDSDDEKLVPSITGVTGNFSRETYGSALEVLEVVIMPPFENEPPRKITKMDPRETLLSVFNQSEKEGGPVTSVYNLSYNTFICTILGCGKSFLDTERFSYHLVLHEDEEDQEEETTYCVDCNVFYDTPYLLQQHMIFTHKKDLSPNYSCPICGITCSSYFQLAEHKRDKHSGTKPYGCVSCVVRFSTKAKLMAHVLRKHKNHRSKEELELYGVNILVCKSCHEKIEGDTFDDVKGNLVEHYAGSHSIALPDGFLISAHAFKAPHEDEQDQNEESETASTSTEQGHFSGQQQVNVVCQVTERDESHTPCVLYGNMPTL